MAGLGSVYVELQLDRSKFDRSLQQLEKDATTTPIQIEKAFANLGIKSSYQFDLLRQKAINNYEAIKHSAQATANDILRAEQAKAAQLKALDEQQYGRQLGMIEKLRGHWLAASAVIASAGIAASKGWELAGTAADFEERVGALDALGRKAGQTGEQIVQGMQHAARGLLSLQDAANLSAAALNLGLSSQQMIEFTRVSEALTDVIGGTIPEAFNRMTVAAASGRTQTLAQMGILVDLDAAYARYADSMGRAAGSLSEAEKQQVRLNTILDAAKAKVDALGPATDSTRDKMDRLGVAMSDLSLRLGETLAGAIVAVIDTMQPANAALERQRELVGGVMASFDAYTGAIEKTNAVLITHAHTILPDVEAALKRTTAAAQAASEETTKAFQKQAEEEAKWWVKEVERQQAEDEKLARYEAEQLQEKARATEKAAADEAAAYRKVREEQIALWDGMNTKIPQAAATASAAVVASAATMTDAFAQASAAASLVAAGISAGGSTPGSALGALQKGGSGLAGRWEETEREWASSRLAEMSERWGGMPIPADIAAKYTQLQLHGGVGQAALENEIARMGREYLNRPISDHQRWVNSGVIPDSGGWSGYATGGVVPGPVGAAQPAIVHGGEAVFTPSQLAALARAGGSRGGDLVIRIALNGTDITQAIRVPLQDAIRAGQVVVQ